MASTGTSENAPRITANFDDSPPVPVEEYAAGVRRANVGYELIFELCLAILRALDKSDLSVLVVGAGGGEEVQVFVPVNPDWRLRLLERARRAGAVRLPAE